MKIQPVILTFACIGLLSTASYGEGGAGSLGSGAASPPTGDPSIGAESVNPGSGTQSQGMGSGTQRMWVDQSLFIQGEIASVQDGMYVVKDQSGKEILLHVDQSTKKTGEFQEGDQIKAEVTEEGHVLKLEKAGGLLQ